MSKIILLLSIFVLIGLYVGAATAAGCDGQWCHPSEGYKCCAGHSCSSYAWQGKCKNDHQAEADQMAAAPTGK